MKPTVKVDGRGISVQLDAIRKQHRFATALALTRTAQDVKAAEEDAMRRSIDRPTPYTMKSLFLKPARRDSLVARVWLKDDAGKGTPAEKYLLPQIIGGGRRVKRFERALQAAGIMPQGMQAVPGRRARRDAYGNVSTGQIRQILSQLRIQLTAGYESRTSLDPRKKRRAIKRADGQFFAITQRRGKLPPGIYQRRLYSSGFGSVTPEAVFLFKPAVRYTPRFDFFGVAERTVRERFPTRFAEAWAQAKATAR